MLVIVIGLSLVFFLFIYFYYFGKVCPDVCQKVVVFRHIYKDQCLDSLSNLQISVFPSYLSKARIHWRSSAWLVCIHACKPQPWDEERIHVSKIWHFWKSVTQVYSESYLSIHFLYSMYLCDYLSSKAVHLYNNNSKILEIFLD